MTTAKTTKEIRSPKAILQAALVALAEAEAAVETLGKMDPERWGKFAEARQNGIGNQEAMIYRASLRAKGTEKNLSYGLK